MAEVVELKEEQWLEELEEMERLLLFSVNEIRGIQRERREHLYRMRKVSKTKNDFIRFIDYEMDLLSKIEEKRLEMKNNDKRNEIDFKIKNRVRKVFLQIIEMYPADMSLWQEYFQFCQKLKFWAWGSNSLQRFLDVHGGKEDCWLYAAEFELGNRNTEKARAWLVAGTQRHPASIELFTALIKLELDLAKVAQNEKGQNTKEVDKEASKSRKQILRGKCAEIAYQNAAKTITDLRFYTEIYKIVSEYPTASKLRDLVLQDIITKYSSSEMAWNMRARLPMNISDVPSKIDVANGVEVPKMDEKDRIVKCIEIYEEAVLALPTMAMWSLYLDFLVEINTHEGKSATNFCKICWKKGMKAALDADMVSDKHYIQYSQHISKQAGKSKKQLVLLERGIFNHPASTQLWYELVKWYLSRGLENDGLVKFRKAISRLKQQPVQEVLALWKLVIHYMIKSSSDKAEAIFLDGIRMRTDLAGFLTPMYLEWTLKSRGIEAARKLLNNPVITHPPCLKFYLDFVKYETDLPEPSVKSIRNLYETLIRHFGPKEPSVWIDYINFELKMGDVKLVPKVHQRATAELVGNKLDIFLSRFSTQDIHSLAL